MSTLRERAIAASILVAKCSCHDDYKLRQRIDPTCFACDYGEAIADAIEAEAKRFAATAIAFYQRGLDLSERGRADSIAWYLASITVGCVSVAEAIAAAERGET